MPSRAQPRPGTENLGAYGGTGYAVDPRKASKQYQASRFAKEKPRSPRAGQSLKFKEKVKAENLIRPLHADLPLKLVKTGSSGFVVQAELPGNEHQPQRCKCPTEEEEEEELVKYMSKVPGYLLRGEKPRDNVFNFGVLDWECLEKWKQSKRSPNDVISGNCSTATNHSSVPCVTDTSALTDQRDQSSRSGLRSFHLVDASPIVKPISGKEINSSSYKKLEIQTKAKPRHRHGHDFKGKAKQSDQGSSFMKETSFSDESNFDYKVSHSKKKVIIPGGELDNCADKFKTGRLGNPIQHGCAKQDNIILLLPKDFSKPGSSEMPHRASLDGKSAELSWGSFSDIFSIDEIQSDELLSDIRHSFPLNDTSESEREIDLKLHTLVKAQGVELPSNTLDMPVYSNENDLKVKTTASTPNKVSGDLDKRALPSSLKMTIDASASTRLSFSGSRLGRSLSHKEGSVHSEQKSTYVSAKSGPANPECFVACETPRSNRKNVGVRARNSPFRRLLDPLLRHRALNKTKEHPNDPRLDPPTAVEAPSCEECEASTVKAFFHVSVTGGLPLFKFMVKASNEILASTVKNLSTFGKDDSRWLYTFYSVHKNRKKSVGWRNHKDKPSGFSYNVIGQMKVSDTKQPSWCDAQFDEQYLVRESVLYSVELGMENAASSELTASRELAAIVVKMQKETDKNACRLSECCSNGRFCSCGEDEMAGHTMVILPGGIHSLPHEGVPSSLINRWRSGGLCDCGGWDVGCKLRILTSPTQARKTLMNFEPQLRCDLFEQAEGEERGPLFSLVPLQEGLLSVEFDAKMSGLQAFSICVAIVNSQMPRDSSASVVVGGGGPRKHTPHPPLSPVGRV